MLMTVGDNSLNELLGSADSPEDFEALEQLVAESEAKRKVRSRWIVESLSEVAELFGLAVQTVKQWRMESPPMPGRQGAWPLPDIIRWRIAKLSGSDLATAKKEQDLQLGQVQLEAKRLELQKERAELVARSDVELWAAQVCVAVRDLVMSIPDAIANSAPPEIRDHARAETDRICRAALAVARRKVEEPIGVDDALAEDV